MGRALGAGHVITELLFPRGRKAGKQVRQARSFGTVKDLQVILDFRDPQAGPQGRPRPGAGTCNPALLRLQVRSCHLHAHPKEQKAGGDGVCILGGPHPPPSRGEDEVEAWGQERNLGGSPFLSPSPPSLKITWRLLSEMQRNHQGTTEM